jgi:c-di-GMP-binding flagellar brake protein YcgR
VFNASSADDAPQPPKVLVTSLEILANLKSLMDAHDPLIVTFTERQQRFQSYVVEVDRVAGTLALDELIPRDGERFMSNGEPFKVEGFHEGVRIAWESNGTYHIIDNDQGRSYHGALPTQVIYHQRRNAFRAALKLSQLVDIKVDGSKAARPVRGKLLDVSATGCKLRFEGNITQQLQLGQVYERFAIALPFGALTTAVELRYLHFEQRLDTTFAGVRFHNMSGPVQRNVDRFVNQLQRDARQFDRDDF